MNNPYEILGDNDPFGLCGINFPVDEALKKCLCPGIEGRTKTAEQELSEALKTIDRAIKMHKEGQRYRQRLKRSESEIHDVIELFRTVFGGDVGLSAARELLRYASNSKLCFLTRAKNFLALFADD
jgi:hypothetical protein